MGSLGKTSYLKEKSFENDSEHFISDSIFKGLEFDYSFSETVQNQRILYRAFVFVNVCSWKSINYNEK